MQEKSKNNIDDNEKDENISTNLYPLSYMPSQYSRIHTLDKRKGE